MCASIVLIFTFISNLDFLMITERKKGEAKLELAGVNEKERERGRGELEHFICCIFKIRLNIIIFLQKKFENLILSRKLNLNK